MKTPCNHPKLVWASHGAYAVVGAVVVLLCHAALGQTIPNPSFEADTFTTFPGYISVNAPITGWTANPTDEVGLNPAGGSPFADNGAIPDGNNVAFIQSGSATDPSSGMLSTTISGLTVGTTYKVTLRANARGGQAPNLRLSIDGTEIMAMQMHSAGPNNPYWYIAFEFAATATSQVLGVLNDTPTDNTLLVDDFSIAPSSGKWVVDAWNDDASSGLDSSFYYTHAYKFGNATNFTLNGVAFTGLGGNNPQVAGSFSTTFLTYGPAEGLVNLADPGSQALADFFDYGYSIPVGSAESITLNGLTPGTTYVATIFSYAWDDITVDPLSQRWATFSMGNDRLTVQQDQFGQYNGIRVSYTYTADSSSNATINIAPVNIFGNVSFHVCGFANREAVSRFVAPTISTQPHTLIITAGLGATFTVSANGLPAPTYQWRYNGGNIGGAQASSYTIAAASGINVGAYDVIVANSAGSVTSVVAQLIVGIPLDNPSFEVDTFTAFPGYCSGNSPITGWTLDVLGGGGLNPASGSPFACGGPIPDGIQFAFIQAPGDVLHQTVSGFTAGDVYYVHYYEGARAGYNSPGMEVTVGGATVLAAHTIPAGVNAYFETFSDVFTATNASLDLAFVKSNPVLGDTVAVLDDIAVVHIAPGTAPFVSRNPQPVLASVADSVTFWAQGVGSPPLAFQWLKDGTAVPGATDEVLTLNNIQKAAEADYSLRITNNSGSATSLAAHLTVYEPIPGLFNTGVDNSQVSLADGSVDPHYQLIVNPDTGSTNAIVEDSSVFPISTGNWLPDTATSKWIGPRFNTSGSAAANATYTYRTVIDLTGRDPSTLIINGQWAVDNTGNDIQVNGHSTGNGKCLGFNPYTAFNIYGTNGLFVAGSNTIDFVTQNTDTTVGYTGLRVEIIRSNLHVPPGVPPTILTAPVSQQAVTGDTITFTAAAGGTAPLGYQWNKDSSPLAGQTTLTLVLTNVTVADNGLYSITVSNSAGTTNSLPAKLEVLWNALAGVYGTGVATNGTLAAGGSVDPHYILTVSADPSIPGPDAIVLNDVYPVGTWLVNGPNSKWIAPQIDQSAGNAEGDYTYETSFTLAAADLNRVQIVGAWASDNDGTNILVNGASTGLNNGAGFGSLSPFMITVNNGLVAGQNILDFVVHNDPVTPNPTGLRIDLRGLLPIGFTPYSLDMNTPSGSSLNASDGTEPLDNWWANEFTAVAGGNVITEVDFGCGTVTAGSYAVASLYRVTGTGGDPALGAVRLYSQTFKPVPGSSGQPNLNKITLTSPVALNVGDRFLVAISMTNVIALAPNDVHPFPIDKSTNSTGSYWDRSAPNTFNLDDLSQAKPIDQALAAGGFVPGDSGGHLYIRAIGTPVTTTGPTLNIRLSSGSAVISWSPTSAGQQLLSAPTPKGPWTAITGAPNPYTATLGATNTFYRVSQ